MSLIAGFRSIARDQAVACGARSGLDFDFVATRLDRLGALADGGRPTQACQSGQSFKARLDEMCPPITNTYRNVHECYDEGRKVLGIA